MSLHSTVGIDFHSTHLWVDDWEVAPALPDPYTDATGAPANPSDFAFHRFALLHSFSVPVAGSHSLPPPSCCVQVSAGSPQSCSPRMVAPCLTMIVFPEVRVVCNGVRGNQAFTACYH